ncbi:MAG: biotin transporter BioY [Candidatus Gastranaerophilales bacterium]|nr:biotin transporter BioY [Candidatus Gastranaerophilales bacterium]
MSQDVLIPKMKRIDKNKRRIKIPLINLVAIFFCTILIIGSTFINLDIKHYIIPSYIFSNKHLTTEDFIYSFFLIPQIPVIMFVCSVLGRKLALTSVLFYLIIGLFFAPVFGLGGGIRYIAQYGFGYILAYIPAVLLAGRFLNKRYSFADMIKATISGVLTIHIIGILYMITIALIKHAGGTFIAGWLEAQSGLKIIYDLTSSFILILIGKYLHKGLKFIID